MFPRTKVPIANPSIIREDRTIFCRILSDYRNGELFMARKFQYYNVYIMKNGNATRLYFSDFLDKVRMVSWRNRLRKIKSHPTALFDLTIPSMDQLCRVAAIGKYRQNVKPYTGDINSATAQMIQNDIIEMTTIVAAPLARTVLIEYNFYGSKARDIQDYFNTFINATDSRNTWSIIFDPIKSNKSIMDIRTSNDIKEVDLKINVGGSMFDQLLTRSQSIEQRNSLFGKVISISQTINDATDAPVIDLTFGKGRKRSLNLAAGEILSFVELLDVDNNDSIESCKVTYRDPSTNKYVELELKNVGIKNDYVLEGDNANHSWEFIGDKILERYITLQRPASTVYTQRGIEFIDEQMPNMVEVPKPAFIVPVAEGERDELVDNLA
jgi:hypothetical protein